MRFVNRLLSVLALCMATAHAWAGFEDPLFAPALPSALASKSPLVAISKAGKRLVAVGQRGIIVVSDDGGSNWVQSAVPVRTDLLAVHFSSPENGWAVGHGGVVVNSRDGGLTWSKQLDGKQASKLIIDYYARAAAKGALSNSEIYGKREESLVGFGGTQAFLGVYFESDLRGYVIGTFGRILRTEDGGKTWEPLMHRVENPKELNFYNIAAGADGMFIVGESGTVWKYSKDSNKFVARPVGYAGTLFGIVVGENVLVAYGMRGSVFRSVDLGDTWKRIELGGHAGVTGGTLLDNQHIILVNLAGSAFSSANHGASFQLLPIPRTMSYFGAVALNQNHLALVGAEGIRLREFNDTQAIQAGLLYRVSATGSK